MEMDNLYLGTAVPKYGTGVGYDYRQATRSLRELKEFYISTTRYKLQSDDITSWRRYYVRVQT